MVYYGNLPHFNKIAFCYFGYVDIIFDQIYKDLIHQKLKSIRCNSALAITSAITGISKKKLFSELYFENLGKRDGTGEFDAF